MENGIRCVVIGDTTLPQACADLLLAQGFTLCAVITRDARVAAWAVERGISCAAQVQDLPLLLGGQAFDYLFSIINDQILGADLLAAPRRLAINYHDAPLPRYAGVHATSWALIEREPTHGISWHVMTAQVDAGDLLRQELFALEDNETALSLNTKCYSAALKAFAALLQDIEAGGPKHRVQDLEQRSYYGGTQRPPAACAVSWSTPAEEMSALVRALQFGPYQNPLGLPKLYIGGRFVTFASLDVLAARSEARAGTIISCGPKALIVATPTCDVALQQFASLEGAPLALDALIAQAHLAPGMELDRLDAGYAAGLSETHQRLARHERYWAAKLEHSAPTALTTLTAPTTLAGGAATTPRMEQLTTKVTADLSAWPANGTRAGIVLAAFAAYLARIERTETLDLGYAPAAAGSMSEVAINDAAGVFAQTVPLHLEVDPAKGLINTWCLLKDELERTVRRGSYLRDIVQRYPALRERGSAVWNWPVQVRIGRTGDTVESLLHTVASLPQQEATCVLQLSITDDGSNCLWRFDGSVVEAGVVKTMALHFHGLLDVMVREPQRPLGAIPLLAETDARRLYAAWNATATAYPKQATIASLFAEQVQRTPHAAALIFDGGQWSYAELDRRAERLAQRLRSAGIGPDTMVGLCSERSPVTIAALLAIVKAGAAYLPLDPTLPQARLRYLLDDAQPAMVLLQQQFLALLQETQPDVACVCIDDVNDELVDDGDDVAISHVVGTVRPANLAYAIYTSGSTGQPKGVVVSQQNVVRLVRNTNYFHIEPGQRMLQLAPLSFDASTFEIWGSLLNGASLVIAAAGNVSVEQIGETIARQHVHTLWLTAALFNQMVEHALPQLLRARHVLAGGEALSPAHVQRFLAGAQQAAREFATAASRLTNGYGPTECTTFSCCHALGEDEGRAGVKANQAIPIGRPIANAQTYILDGHLNPVPPGVVGELYIGGDGLARGYLGRPGMTAEKFVPDPYGSMPGGRLYRSGDLARYLPDGRIDYVGRIDGQVKLRGFRIELGEIEAALYALGQLEHAVVLAREDNPGDRRLVAYLVPQAGLTVPEAEVLRRQLQHTLPDYMVPAHFVVLDTLPLTPNGKLDRRALPVPAQRRGGSDYVAPRNATEETLARIWADVLKLDRVGIHDNFFALGGHSLMTTAVIVRIRNELRVELPLRILFEVPTIDALAGRISYAGSHIDPRFDAVEEQSATSYLASASADDAVSSAYEREQHWIMLDHNLSLLASRKTSQRHVFLIPGAGGGTEVFHGIARGLSAAGCHAYALQYDGVDNENRPDADIDLIADKYLRQILPHCDAPVVIAGYCTGGAVAYEIARRLAEQRHVVAQLVFIDTPLPHLDVLPALDLETLKCEFFKAISEIYADAQGGSEASIFAGLGAEACIEIAVAAMKLNSPIEIDSWKSIIRRRYRAETTHVVATRRYWENLSLHFMTDGDTGKETRAFPLRLVETSEMRDKRRADLSSQLGGRACSHTAWADARFRSIVMETVDGCHATALRDHESLLVKALMACFEGGLVESAVNEEIFIAI